VALVITGASNAVNLTDGLDGLATGTAAMAAVAFAGLAYLSGHARFSEYLNILFVREAGELTVFLAAMVGAALGSSGSTRTRRRSSWATRAAWHWAAPWAPWPCC
jgi:phospho-N-acetylmuramoyl-pentapeptide-transferase